MIVKTGQTMMSLAMLFAVTTVLAAGWSRWLGLLAATWIGMLYFYLRQIEHKQVQALLAQRVEDFANKLMNDLKEDLNKGSIDDYAAKN